MSKSKRHSWVNFQFPIPKARSESAFIFRSGPSNRSDTHAAFARHGAFSKGYLWVKVEVFFSNSSIILLLIQAVELSNDLLLLEVHLPLLVPALSVYLSYMFLHGRRFLVAWRFAVENAFVEVDFFCQRLKLIIEWSVKSLVLVVAGWVAIKGCNIKIIYIGFIGWYGDTLCSARFRWLLNSIAHRVLPLELTVPVSICFGTSESWSRNLICSWLEEPSPTSWGHV